MTDLVTRLREAMADEALRLSELPPWPWKLNAEGDEILAADDEEICTGWALSSRQQRAVAAYIVDQDPQAKLRRIEIDRKILEPHTPMQWAFKWIGPMENPANRAPDMRCSACWTDYDPDGKFDHECHHAPHEWPCATVLALAEAYGVEA